MPRKARQGKEIFIDSEDLTQGLYALEDTTKAPYGSARVMKNMRVTDRGGIAPRLGTELIGTKSASSSPSRGFFNFRKSFETNEVLLRAYDDELEAYSLNHADQGWWKLKDGFTADKEFGFVPSLVNTDDQDYVIFCNRFEPYQTWRGAVTLLDGALSGGESSVVVDSVLEDEVLDSHAGSEVAASSSTTLQLSNAEWAASQWNNFYVYIKSGTKVDEISKITGTTTDTITFDALTGDPGSADFEIRKLAFPATGTLIYGGTTIAYTDIPKYNTFTVSSAHAAADNTPVTVVPTEYPANPRGNRFTNYLNRIIVGNVRSAIARDSGGTKEGYSAAGSYFVSKVNNHTDFDFSASRVAGEGDIVSTPYGGGDITDVAHQEDTAYVFKKRYIEAVQYSQDADDLAVREPLKSEIGSLGQVIKGPDDVYFTTSDNKITSIGRIRAKDIKPQTENIGSNIQRLLDEFVFGDGRGIVNQDLLMIPAKEDSTYDKNNIVLVYSLRTGTFWGVWHLSANYLEEFDGDTYFADSLSPNVYKMLTGHADVEGTDRLPISASYATHFMNLANSQSTLQAMNGIYFEGYIKGESTITFEIWKDLNDESFLEFDFSGSEDDFLSGNELTASLGGEEIALSPLGALGDTDSEGRRHFYFRLYFPFQYGNTFSVGWSSDEPDDDYEITRFGMLMKETVSKRISKVKSNN